MDLLTTNVSVFEPNETRADLYSLWLDEYNVRVALTRQEADEVLDGSAGVVLVNRAFADGQGATLVEIARARNPVCAVVAIRDRSAGFPAVDPANHLVQPVFEDELEDLVDRLMRRVNYRVALEEYYRASASIASFEFKNESPSEDERDRLSEFQERADRLKTRLGAYRREMDDDDVTAVIQSLTFRDDVEHTSGSGSTSKYQPDQCTNCGRDWDVTPSDDRARGFKQLGAFVWRCVECGHVQMQAGPSHQHVGSYRVK